MSVIWQTSRLTDGPMGKTIEMTAAQLANRERFVRTHFGVDVLSPVMV